MHAGRDLHACRAAIASRSVRIGGARARALGLRRDADGASRGSAAEILAGRSLAHQGVDEADCDKPLTDAARAREQVGVRGAAAQFGEQPACGLAMAEERSYWDGGWVLRGGGGPPPGGGGAW